MKTFKIMLLGLGISVLSYSVFAARMAPATIAPITTKHGIIEHSFERNDQGFRVYVVMKDKAGDLRWKTKIFGRRYEKNLETDVQDIHLKKLSLEESNIIAVDEMGRRYEVDMGSGSLTKPNKPADYSLQN